MRKRVVCGFGETIVTLLPAKSRLQEWTLGRGLGLPIYTLTSSEGPAHNPVFKVTVAAAGREADGVGATKRAAEQAAAEAWLLGLQRT